MLVKLTAYVDVSYDDNSEDAPIPLAQEFWFPPHIGNVDVGSVAVRYSNALTAEGFTVYGMDVLVCSDGARS